GTILVCASLIVGMIGFINMGKLEDAIEHLNNNNLKPINNIQTVGTYIAMVDGYLEQAKKETDTSKIEQQITDLTTTAKKLLSDYSKKKMTIEEKELYTQFSA